MTIRWPDVSGSKDASDEGLARHLVAEEAPATAEEYEAALRRIAEDLTDTEREALQIHYHASDQMLTAEMLARRLGYNSFEPASSTYGHLARKVGEALGIDGYDIGADSKWHWPILAVGMRSSPFRWFLRKEVDEALRRIGWFGSPFRAEGHTQGLQTGDLSDYGNEGPAERSQTVVSRIARDAWLSWHVKKLHDFVCQICETTLEVSKEERYAEAHHIKPLGAPHDGPDVAANILCVCPNCRVLLDRGARPIDPDDLRRVSDHRIGSDYVAYHNEQIVVG